MEADKSITLVRIDWMDSEGQRWADAADLNEIPKALESIEEDSGTLVGVGLLEER
jgi:hypothetical protein